MANYKGWVDPYQPWFHPPAHRIPLKWKIASRLMVAAVGAFSKLWIEWMNKIDVHNKETLTTAIESRSPQRGLVTVCNHTSCMDDPLIWGVLKMRVLLNRSYMRWIPVAEDICFTKPLHSLFFSLGQCVPVRRGSGVYQKGMDFLLERLNAGQWVHFFAEGVGRAVADCKTSPIVLPMIHVGMDDILPNKKPYIPRIRKNATLLVGNPMDFAKDIELLKTLKKSPRDIRKHITDKLQEEMIVLREQALHIHSEVSR
ncbi:tafazzin-like isoform X2 [Babylonia areolata]|uniref:tafazzin-like isoform X2 n=1 Tax=Babylonia areolata TaxID=304850 RepID=UPI003FD58EA3